MPALRKTRSRSKAQAHPRRRAPRWARIRMRTGLIAAAIALLAGTGLWLFGTDPGRNLVTRAGTGVLEATAGAGLAVDHVLVTGRERAGVGEVSQALGVTRGMPILAFDPHAAKKRLETLPWVRRAIVERRLPDTVYVRIAEREALALWQSGGAFALIDTEGTVIPGARLGRYHDLPLVVGRGAPEHANAMIRILRSRPGVNDEVKALVRVADRRWDLQFRNGIVARLPEDGAARAVAQLAELIARDRILERDIVSLDLRLPGRLVVRTREDTKPDKTSRGNKRSPGRARET